MQMPASCRIPSPWRPLGHVASNSPGHEHLDSVGRFQQALVWTKNSWKGNARSQEVGVLVSGASVSFGH